MSVNRKYCDNNKIITLPYCIEKYVIECYFLKEIDLEKTILCIVQKVM